MLPIKPKKIYDDIIKNLIIEWQYEYIFKPCFDILKEENITNSGQNIIISAIKNGLIYYQDGAFYSTRKRFSNAISLELEKLGAKYSKLRKAYIINPKKIPIEVISSIDTSSARTAGKVLAIKKYFDYFKSNIDEITNKLVFDTAAETIMQDLQNRVYENFSKRKIETISPKLTDFRANEIAKNYTNNLNYWIKNWSGEEIVKMRETVGQMAIDGKSNKTIAEYIHNRYGVGKKKALFLARNENAIATTSYLKAKYQEEGFTHYRWITNFDGRERPLHKELGQKYGNKYGIDGTNIFSFDDPPIIDERTGQRGNPSETYNCRCTFIPVINKEFIENRLKK